MRLVLVVFAFLLATLALAQEREYPRMNELDWLHGTWSGEITGMFAGPLAMTFEPTLGGKFVYVGVESAMGDEDVLGEGYLGWSPKRSSFVLHTFTNSDDLEEPRVELATLTGTKLVLLPPVSQATMGDVVIRQTWEVISGTLHFTMEVKDGDKWLEVGRAKLQKEVEG